MQTCYFLVNKKEVSAQKHTLSCVDVMALNLVSSNLKNNSILNILCGTGSYPSENQTCQDVVVIVCHLGIWIHWHCDRGMNISAAIFRPKILTCLHNTENSSPGIFHHAMPMARSVHSKDKMENLPLRSYYSATDWFVNLGVCCFLCTSQIPHM